MYIWHIYIYSNYSGPVYQVASKLKKEQAMASKEKRPGRPQEAERGLQLLSGCFKRVLGFRV